MVRRVHDEATGAYGNDTRMDLWHGTSGDYDGLDRFGRIVDMKFTDFSGTATDFERREYTYDRNYNRTSIEHTLYKADSQSFTLDDLNRITDADRGFLNSSDTVYASETLTDLGFDLLGNFTSTAGGIKVNSDSASITHVVNAANEITSLDQSAAAGEPKVIDDEFTSQNAFWTEDTGDWSVSSGELNVDTLSSGEAIILADADLDMLSYSFKVKFPSSSSTNKAGLLFAYDSSSDDGYAVVIDRNTDKLAFHQISSGSLGSALDSDDLAVSDSTFYTVMIMRRQGGVIAWVDGQSTFVEYNASSDFNTGETGLYSDKTDVKFDNFFAYDMTARDPKALRLSGSAKASIDTDTEDLLVENSTHRAEVRVDNFFDDDYMVQVDLDLNSGTYGDIWFRYIDSNNGYMVKVDTDTNSARLFLWENGSRSLLSTANSFPGVSASVKIKVSGTSIKVWFDGSLKFDTTDSTFDAGGVAFSGNTAKFDDLKIGYDLNRDDDIDDVGDYVILVEDFSLTEQTIAYDNAGNLIDDGTFVFIYDAWNRLVKVRASEESNVTLQEAEFDGLGRRIKKVVTNSGEYDGTEVYLYDGHRIIEVRDGSSNVTKQFVYGTQYTDELVMIRVTNKGELYVHQDANWNVIALTDLGGHVVERYIYRPYGEVVVHQDTSYGDYDGDQDVDLTDRGGYSGSSPSGAERILDLDFDGDVDGTDTTLFNNNLTTGISRHPGRISTGVEQPFGHQGLMYDAEITSYQNRHRQLASVLRRFLQRDPIGYVDGMSLYAYCGGNPIIGVDSLGLLVLVPVWYSYKITNLLGIPDPLPPFLGHNIMKKPDEERDFIALQTNPEKAKFGTEFVWFYGENTKIKGALINPDGTIIRPCSWDWLYGRFNLLPDNPWALGWWYWHNTKIGSSQEPTTPKWSNSTSIKWEKDPLGESETTCIIDEELYLGQSKNLWIEVTPDLDKPGVKGKLRIDITLTCKGTPATWKRVGKFLL
jgi:RHS repeat-associated protein